MNQLANQPSRIKTHHTKTGGEKIRNSKEKFITKNKRNNNHCNINKNKCNFSIIPTNNHNNNKSSNTNTNCTQTKSNKARTDRLEEQRHINKNKYNFQSNQKATSNSNKQQQTRTVIRHNTNSLVAATHVQNSKKIWRNFDVKNFFLLKKTPRGRLIIINTPRVRKFLRPRFFERSRGIFSYYNMNELLDSYWYSYKLVFSENIWKNYVFYVIVKIKGYALCTLSILKNKFH